MLLARIKKMAIIGAAAFMLLLIGNSDTNAQTRRQIERERQRIEREQRQLESRRGRGRNDQAIERRVNNSSFNTGYEQGLLAGRYDRRRGKYNQSNVYRGTGSNPSSGDPTSLDYMYRQGYLQGYQDGYQGRTNNY